jgi:hypothetical protein
MTLSEVGAMPAEEILQYNWHASLTADQLAAYVRYQFIRLNENVSDWDARAHSRRRRVWDGTKDHSGVPHISVWHKIVDQIKKAAAHPGMWVQAHFSPAAERQLNVASGLSDLQPRMLHSGRSAYVYHKYTEIGPKLILHASELAADTIKLRIQSTAGINFSPADRMAYVLCDEAYVTASPFFRCAVAARYNCETAMNMYLWRAAVDYEANQPLYDYVIADSQASGWWLHNALKTTTNKIRTHWRAYCG